MRQLHWIVAVTILAGIGMAAPQSFASPLAAGDYHTCLQVANGTAYCWGTNNYGQLGNGTYDPASTPVPVKGIINASSISASRNHSCALLKGGSVSCWGLNDYGKLTNPDVLKVLYNSTPLPIGKISTAVVIADGAHHTCALLKDGNISCWGSNDGGMLGDGTQTNSSTPVTVQKLAGAAIDVVAGDWHTCALLKNGTISCWGFNITGQLGSVTKDTLSVVPVTVTLPAPAVALSASWGHTCAVLKDGTVYCWGANSDGQLGNGIKDDSATPVQVLAITNALSVSAGVNSTCAVLQDGSVRCWGSIGNFGAIPSGVKGLPDKATAVAVGLAHACAMLKDGAAYCWGNNTDGQLGDGTKNTPADAVKVSLDATATLPAPVAALCTDSLAKVQQDGETCSGSLAKAQQDLANVTHDMQTLKSNMTVVCSLLKQIPPKYSSLIQTIYNRLTYIAGCK